MKKPVVWFEKLSRESDSSSIPDVQFGTLDIDGIVSLHNNQGGMMPSNTYTAGK